MPIPDRVTERAATRYDVDENGCWISTYSTGSHGYAQVGWQDGDDRTMVLAHRAAWVYRHGAEPAGTVDHTCHVRPCVNPAHLRDLPNVENARRNSPENEYPLGQSCKRDHASELRVPRRKQGRITLTCKGCERIWQQAKRARRATRAAMN
jgi:hypothetical protein